jgi:DUF1365 family protein
VNEPALLYACEVMHRRYQPISYLFRYRIFSLLVDIDRLDELNSLSAFFSVDRFNLFSFHRQDHLPQGQQELRVWVEGVLSQSGLEGTSLRIRLLCMPRVLGWGFDPLSIWYCETQAGEPLAAICEVHNTFGERHCYLLRARDGEWPLRDGSDKVFHVSPFMDVRGRYTFALGQPGEQLRVAIQLSDEGQPLLSATQIGEKRLFATRHLLRFFLRIPFQTAKVLGAIHWHALKIWLRGVPFFHKPEPPLEEISK